LYFILEKDKIKKLGKPLEVTRNFQVRNHSDSKYPCLYGKN